MAVIEITPQTAQSLSTATFNARLVGLTPLLMHKPNMLAQAAGLRRTATKRIPTPEEEAAEGAYRFEDGTLYLPAVSLQRSMVEAAKAFKDPVRTRASLMKAVAATLTPPPVEGYALLDPDTGEAIGEYEIDVRRAVVQRAAIMRARPRIDAWVADVSMDFDFDAPTGSNGAGPEGALEEAGKRLLDVLVHAGSKVGVGDYRPERSGPFGRFRVEQFIVSNE